MMGRFIVALPFLLSACIQVQTRFNQQTERDQFLYGRAQVSGATRGDGPSDEVRLKLLENNLKGKTELDQYGKALPYFKTMQEKIEFLSLPTFKERQKWLNQREFWSRIREKEELYAPYVQMRDIAVGMTAELVRKAWGDPNEMAVSGAPALGNMMWIYIQHTPDQGGYQKRKRVVYFESGQVVGWDTQ